MESVGLALLGVVLGIFIGALVAPVRERVEMRSRRLVGGHGLVVTQLRNPDGIPSADGFFSSDPEFCELEPPEMPSQFADWAYASGAADIGCTEILVTLQATADTTLVLGSPRLELDSVPTRPGGRWEYNPGRGGGRIDPRVLQVRLHSERDGSLLGYQMDGQTQRFSLQMSKGEVEQLKIVATADDALTHWWRLVLPVIVNGIERAVSIDNSGSPFTTIGSLAPIRIRRVFPGGC